MSEALSADISIATHEAFRNLAALLAVVDNAQKSLENMGGAINKVESEVSELAVDLKEAEEQFRKTGAEADRLRMEDARRAMDDAAGKAHKLKAEFDDLQRSINLTSGAQLKASKEFVAASQQMGTAGAKAGEETAKAQKKAKDATEDTTKAGEGLGDVVETLTSRATSMVSSFLGLGAVLKILESMEESLRNSIKATDELAGRKVAFQTTIQDVIDNLGFMPDKAGQDRAGKLVNALQQRAGGLTPEVATTILAKAQATGFKVADAAHPELDAKNQAFEMAAQVGRFATRTRLDPETAGKLFNMAQIAGVKSTVDMEKMLAEIEVAFQDIAITNPAEGMRTAIRASAGRMAADRTMTMQQALGSVAAAAVGETDPALAATNAERFTRATMGTTVPGKKFLSEMAAGQGLITPAQIAAGMEAARQRVPKDNVDEARRAAETIEEQRRAILKAQREEADVSTDYSARRLALLAERDKAGIHGKAATVESKQAEINKLDREVKQKIDDSAAARATLETKISENEIKIKEYHKKDNDALRALALQDAYASIPISQREEMIWRATEGMSDAQLSFFISRFAEGDIQQDLLKMMSPAARAARKAVVSGKADIGAFRKRDERFFGSNTLALGAQARAQGGAWSLQGTPGGAEFSTEIFGTPEQPGGLVADDIRILQSSGWGGSGIGASSRPMSAPGMDDSGEVGRRATERIALTEAGLQARRAAIIIYDRFKRWVQTLDPRTRARNDARIREAWKHMIRWYKYATAEELGAFGVGRTGTRQLDAAKQMALGVGAVMQEVNADAAQNGEKMGEQGATGLQAPALYQQGHESDFSTPIGSDTPKSVERDLGEDNAPASGVTPSGPAIVPVTPLGPAAPQATLGGTAGGARPAASAAGGTPVSFNRGTTYNLNIGTVVSQGADSLTDLPGRLDLPDLT